MDVICIGEALIDFFAVQPGLGLRDVTEFRRIAGGAPANVAVGVAKLGKKSAFIGCVGNDEFGFYLRDVLVENQVNVELLQFDNSARTGLAFISLPTPTTREFLFYRNPSADMHIDSKKFDIKFIQKAKIFHFGSITLISEPSCSSTLKAVEIARKAGSIISYDPNLRISLSPDSSAAKEQIRKAVPLADIIKVNNEELEFLTGETDIKKGLKELLKGGAKLGIVTIGAEGSFFSAEDFNGFVPVYDVKTVDTTGCGDSFVAAMLSRIADRDLNKVLDSKEEIISIVEMATAAASLTSMKKGVIPALPRKNELDNFIRELKNNKEIKG